MRWFVGAVPALLMGCGSFGEGQDPADASSANDAARDDAAVGSGPDAGDAGPDSSGLPDLLCQAGQLFCRSTRACVKSCAASCGESTIDCIRCDADQNNPVGICEAATAPGSCLIASYAPGEHCNCSNAEVSNCLSSQHVCLEAGSTDWCVTCGEQGQATDGKPCKGGGTCNAAKSPPGCE